MKPAGGIAPGATIGMLGGGQLGRMTALAAAAMGYRTHIFCQSADEPAAQVTNRVTLGAFTDHAALGEFARAVDVVTLEWENIPVAAVTAVNAVTPVYPGGNVLEIAQDRVAEKDFARSCGVGTADYLAVDTVGDLATTLKNLTGQALLKTRRMGYDGKGQARLVPGDDARDVWQKIGGAAAILESLVDFQCEISVIVARRTDGAMAVFPPVRNIHKDGILAETHAPADISQNLQMEAEDIARRLAARLNLVGLLAVEMFVLPRPNAAGQSILVNEIAPRPHNSGHWTIDACATSQFEQLVRAVCGLPLGAVTPTRRSVMYNLIGDAASDWSKWLAMPNAHLHLYGKTEARSGRKMGHVTVIEN
ncbi:MAG: 5-(carboxyamino)imidazole ribonucleotide synthase [Alphaproteobacteria bacterium]